MRTNAQERAHLKKIELDRMERDLADARTRGALIRGGGGRLETGAPVPPRKKKVTVALWFGRLDTGYRRRINGMPKTYMLAVISNEVLGAGDRDRHGDEIWGKVAPKRKEA